MVNVKINNFQSIGSVDFAIDGLTVIVGKNNLGKSAIIRAINAALTNQIGKEYIRHGKSSCEVIFKKDDLQIEWTKSDSASYKIKGKDLPKDGETYSRLNRNVPDPILNAGFRKLEVGDRKLDPLYADQFNPLFLIDEVGSLITEALSTIYKLNVLSTADDLCQKELRSNKGFLKTRTEDLGNLSEQMDKFKDMDTVKKELSDLAVLEEKCERIKNTLTLITAYQDKLSSYNKKIKFLSSIVSIKSLNYTPIAEKIESLNWVLLIFSKLQSIISTVKALKNIYDTDIPSYQKIGDKIEQFSLISEWYGKIAQSAKTINKRINIVNILTSSEKERTSFTLNIQKKIEKLNEADIYYSDFNKFDLLSKKSSAELERVTIDMDKVQKELSNFKTCPACGKPL